MSISLLKNLISGPYNKVSSLLTPGIILSSFSNPSNILVIIKTDENKIFGGYTSLKIEYSGGWKKGACTAYR